MSIIGEVAKNDAGSNDEKISDIIQNMECPFIALKAISLF